MGVVEYAASLYGGNMRKFLKWSVVVTLQYVTAVMVLMGYCGFKPEYMDAREWLYLFLLAEFGWMIASTAYFLAAQKRRWVRWSWVVGLQLAVPWVLYFLFWVCFQCSIRHQALL